MANQSSLSPTNEILGQPTASLFGDRLGLALALTLEAELAVKA